MRKFFSKLHLWLSVPVGLVITVVCLTGAVMLLEQDITEAQHPELYRVQPPCENAVPLAPSELVARVSRQVADTLQISFLQYSGRPDETARVTFQNRATLSVNPYTGEAIGYIERSPFFNSIRKLHRYLMDAPAKRGEQTAGKLIVGISTLLFVFILISGLVIWFPRTCKGLKQRLSVSCTKGWRRFIYDSHVSLGFYATIFLLLMALTGLTWSFGWYRTAVYSLFGASQTTQQPAPQTADRQPSDSRQKTDRRPTEQEHKGDRQRGHKDGTTFDYAVWDKVLTELQAEYPQYKTITLATANAQIAPNPKTSMRRLDTAEFNDHGHIRHIQRYEDQPKSQKLHGWIYALHTGIWGGVWTKILYFLAALIGGLAPLSGYYLWIKRLLTKHKK